MSKWMERGHPARPNVKGMIARLAIHRAGGTPALLLWGAVALVFSMTLRAETGTDVSADFTVDTRVTPPSGVGYSSLFTVDTRYGLGNGANASRLFTIDTRFSGSSGSGESGLFTVDTLNAITPSVAVTGRVTTMNGVGLLAATVQAVINNRVLAVAGCDFDGNYALPVLPPGTYELRATRQNFLSNIKRGVVLNAGQTKGVNFALAPPPFPPNTQVTSRQVEATQLPVVTSSQLRIWNGSAFVTGLSLDPNKMTIVLTHGYISSSDDWPTTMAQHLGGAGGVSGNANITAWDWREAAASTPGLAYSGTRRLTLPPVAKVGLALTGASALLPPRPRSPMHG